MSSIVLILATLLSLSTFAQTNYLAVVGGGGEPKGNTTIFDQSLKNVGNFIKSSDKWIPRIAFNGGHPLTEQIINDMTPPHIYSPKKPFTKDEFEDLISRYKTKIENGDIGPSDKILLLIDTHGAKKSDKENTHLISTNDGFVSLDGLQDLIDTAEAHNVKLGIVDASCHSGNTLNLKSEKTCVISATSPFNYGFTSWSDTFSKNLKIGKNLEQIFLESYGEKSEPSFPMISTDAGKEIQREFQYIMSRYLVYKEKDKDTDYFTEEITRGLNPLLCDMTTVIDSGPLEELLKLEQIIKKNINPSTSFHGLISKIEKYQAFQLAIKKDLLANGAEKLKKTNKEMCSDDYCQTWTELEILTMDIDAELSRIKKINVASETDKKWYSSYQKNLEKAKIHKGQLIASQSKYSKIANYYKKNNDLVTKTNQMSMGISNELQSVYNSIYKEKSRKQTGPNPCKEFVL